MVGADVMPGMDLAVVSPSCDTHSTGGGLRRRKQCSRAGANAVPHLCVMLGDAGTRGLGAHRYLPGWGMRRMGRILWASVNDVAWSPLFSEVMQVP